MQVALTGLVKYIYRHLKNLGFFCCLLGVYNNFIVSWEKQNHSHYTYNIWSFGLQKYLMAVQVKINISNEQSSHETNKSISV